MYAEEAAVNKPTMDMNDMNVRFALLKKFMELPKTKQEEYARRVNVQKTAVPADYPVFGEDT